MRTSVKTLFRRLLDLTGTVVEEVRLDGDQLVVVARCRAGRQPRCSGCGKARPRYDRRKPRRWKSLPFGRTEVWVEYAPWRVECADCGVVSESVPWSSSPRSQFTSDFEEQVAYLAQIMSKTDVATTMGIAWYTVGDIVERVVARRSDPDRLDGIKRLGMDEFSYRKRHNYLTIIVDHDRRQVVWAGPGRSAKNLSAFFEALGPERCAQVELVTMDMAGGYQKAVRDNLANAKIVFDRFHVERLAHDAVDEVRREIVRLEGGPDARAIKGMRFVVLTRPDRLSDKQRMRLADLPRLNEKLYRAYLIKEALAYALSQPTEKRARSHLRGWLAWAERSRLKPFLKAAKTVRKHFEGIIAYVSTKLTNALSEGINGKLRVAARRAYGFHSARPLIAMLFLTDGGITLNPPLPGTKPTLS